VQKEVIKIK